MFETVKTKWRKFLSFPVENAIFYDSFSIKMYFDDISVSEVMLFVGHLGTKDVWE